MKLKQRVGDFRVRELLRPDYLSTRGSQRVYRVTKRKLTSDEAARILAEGVGVEKSQVSMAGLKDRQGLTIQYMSVPGGREVQLQSPELRVETAGFAEEPLSSADSLGNAFELTVRALRRTDLDVLRANLPRMREFGTVDYFDDQRFGNLTHGQGWIFRDLALGHHEQALRSLLSGRSPRDDERHQRFKDGLDRYWGDWRECRDVAGRFGAHHSIFEYLNKNDGDFAGAFAHVGTRIKLIHLYAFQSHLWNRALVERVRALVPVDQRVVMECSEGRLLSFAEAPPAELSGSFPLPGEQLADVEDPVQRELFERVLASEGLEVHQLAVTDVPGFRLKGEPREVLVHPRHLRVRPPEPDNQNPGLLSLKVRFELPRGAYATLIVKRLFAGALGERPEGERRPGAVGTPEERPVPRGRGRQWLEDEDRPRSTDRFERRGRGREESRRGEAREDPRAYGGRRGDDRRPDRRGWDGPRRSEREGSGADGGRHGERFERRHEGAGPGGRADDRPEQRGSWERRGRDEDRGEGGERRRDPQHGGWNPPRTGGPGERGGRRPYGGQGDRGPRSESGPGRSDRDGGDPRRGGFPPEDRRRDDRDREYRGRDPGHDRGRSERGGPSNRPDGSRDDSGRGGPYRGGGEPGGRAPYRGRGGGGERGGGGYRGGGDGSRGGGRPWAGGPGGPGPERPPRDDDRDRGDERRGRGGPGGGRRGGPWRNR